MYLPSYCSWYDFITVTKSMVIFYAILVFRMASSSFLQLRSWREEPEVKFPIISVKSSLHGNYYEIGKSLQSKKWNLERLLEDMRKEQSMLDQAKFMFEIKKQEFVRFLAQNSHYAPAQVHHLWVMLEYCFQLLNTNHMLRKLMAIENLRTMANSLCSMRGNFTYTSLNNHS